MATLITVVNAGGSDHPVEITSGTESVVLVPGQTSQSFEVPESKTGWWVTPYHFGVDQGPVVLMIENYRTGLLWNIMRRCPAIVTGLRRAGFTGGWL